MPPRLVTLVVLLVAAGAGPRPAALASPTGRPNVVVILADDMGYGDPSCNSPGSKIATRHIDRLAAEGLRFNDAHSPGAWCTPSRYGLLTGRYPFRYRGKWGARCIEEGRPTLATLLREQGYATAMVGKWHLGFEAGADPNGPDPMVGGPLECGFDRAFGIPASLDIPPYYYFRDRRPVAAPSLRVEASATEGWSPIQGVFWRAGGIAEGFRHDEVLPRMVEEAVGFVESTPSPFFLYLALPAPHTPWLPAAPFRGRSGAGMYGDFVLQVDAAVGEVLDALDRSGRSDDTLVLFTSDNGPVWYPRDVERFGHRSVGPLRGMKSDAWEGGHRVPFLVRWPDRVARGTTSDRLVVFTDVMATLADALRAPSPPGGGEDSVSFLPALLGEDAPPRGPTVLKADATVLRDGRWKLITHLGSGGFSAPRREEPDEGGPTGQLYDLESDLGETKNRWSEEPEVVARMLARLAALTGERNDG